MQYFFQTLPKTITFSRQLFDPPEKVPACRPHVNPMSTPCQPHVDPMYVLPKPTPRAPHGVDMKSTWGYRHVDICTTCRPHVNSMSTPRRLHVDPRSTPCSQFLPPRILKISVDFKTTNFQPQKKYRHVNPMSTPYPTSPPHDLHRVSTPCPFHVNLMSTPCRPMSTPCRPHIRPMSTPCRPHDT